MDFKGMRMEEELTIPRDWYFNDGDREDIMNWEEPEAEKVWKKIQSNVHEHHYSGLQYKFCPFCHFHDYVHAGPGKTIQNHGCQKCGYGRRHGICSGAEGASDFRKIISQFEADRIDMYRYFSTNYYSDTLKKAEKTAQDKR
jgi:hypothetical protein